MALQDILSQRRIIKNDISEFEKLFRSYYEPLCRFAFHLIHDMDAAEEIVQEFFYNYWKNRETLEVKLSLKAYLYRSIRNNSLRYLEHVAITRKHAKEVMAVEQDIDAVSTSDALEMSELNAIVDRTLSELPERCCKVFKLSRFEGLKYQEIAESLSISVKTVEADMGKALQHFRKNLKHYQEYAL